MLGASSRASYLFSALLQESQCIDVDRYLTQLVFASLCDPSPLVAFLYPQLHICLDIVRRTQACDQKTYLYEMILPQGVA